MKAKKFLALVLALIMALSCMSLTALAEEVTYSEDITVTIPVTLGDTPETLASKASYSDTENLELVDIRLYSSGNPMESISELGVEYSVDCIFKLKGSGFARFAGANGGFFQIYAGNASLNGEKATTTMLGISYNDGHLDMAWNEEDALYTYVDVISYVTLNDPTIDQLYDVTVTENQTDVTKVQVSWELSNIQASVTSNKIWDTEKLEWVNDTTKENGAEVEDGTAEFTFVNLSSVKIDAQVTFAVAEGFTPVTPEFSNSKITLGTKADGEDVKNNGEITVTVTPDAKDFATLTEDATNVKYGTYTVTIGKTPVYKLKKGDLIYMNLTAAEGNEMYRVIKVDGTKVELLAMEDAEVKMAYDADKTTTDFGGGTMGAKYAGSDLDTYLNETWFNNLSDTAQKAIVAKTIKQDMWNDNWDDGEKTLSDKYVDIGERFVYALSMSEVQDYLEMALKNDADMKKAVLNMFYSDGKKHSTSLPYLRSTRVSNSPDYVYAWCVDGGYGSLDRCTVISTATAARPALTIDLSMMGADCWSYADQ